MNDTQLTVQPTHEQIGQMANQYAAQSVFTDYQGRSAKNTKRRHKDDLKLFSSYLSEAGIGIEPEALLNSPEAWRNITHGLVEGFVRWMIKEGYSIGSVNVRLFTVRLYCKLAVRAGVLSSDAYALIRLVQGYGPTQGRHIDETREVTRVGEKKAQPVSISSIQTAQLKTQPDTPQGRRDTLLMCLLLDHGLRCGEIAKLSPGSLNADTGELTFHRDKVGKEQKHQLTRDTHQAALRYLECCSPLECLIMGSRKGGKLEGAMSERAITDRVRVLGESAGLVGLSAHDCRHYWATSAIKGGTDIRSLQDAGGWSSPVMPLRYAESNRIANQGVKLG